MRRILIILVVALVVSICTSCNRNQRKEVEDCLSLSCKNSPLYRFLHYYVDAFPRYISERRCPAHIPYVFAYFFNANNANYVTVWRYSDIRFLDIISRENPDRDFIFRYLHVFVEVPEEFGEFYYDVIIITDQYFDSYNLLPDFDCFLNIEDKRECVDGIINDGGVDARTYRYFIDGEYFVFKRQEQFNIDFLGEWWVEWETFRAMVREEIRVRDIREGRYEFVEPEIPWVVRFRIVSDSD